MTTFKRHRNLKELRAVCRQRRWKLHTEKFKEGSDYVSFDWRVGRMAGTTLVSMINGRFFGETTLGFHYTSDENLDSRAWFMALLNTVYLTS